MTVVSRYELNEPAIVAETVDGEVMVMNLREGIYYSIAGTGAMLWPALAGGNALDAIAASLARAGGVPVSRVASDLDAFVAQLVDEAVLRLRASTDAHVAAGVLASDPALELPEGLSYAAPVVERFDDMRAMLVIDPVHEVGELGWPHTGGGRGR